MFRSDVLNRLSLLSLINFLLSLSLFIIFLTISLYYLPLLLFFIIFFHYLFSLSFCNITIYPTSSSIVILIRDRTLSDWRPLSSYRYVLVVIGPVFPQRGIDYPSMEMLRISYNYHTRWDTEGGHLFRPWREAALGSSLQIKIF